MRAGSESAYARAIAALPACGGMRATDTGFAGISSESAAAERRIGSLVTDWFARLASDTRDRRAALKRPLEASFELARAGVSTQDAAGIDAWLDELRSLHPRVEFAGAALRSRSTAEPSLYEAHFAVERRAIDEQGLPRLASREQRWLVRLVPGAEPAISRIEDQPTLSFPGTGPRIVCN